MLVLFLTSSPLHKMHFTDMYINAIGESFDTKIWDISEICGTTGGDSEFPEVQKLHTLDELETEVNRIEDRVVVITNVLIFKLYIIYDIFHKRGIPLVSIDKESIIFWIRDCFFKEHQEYASKSDLKKFFWKKCPLTRKVYSYLEYRHVKFDYVLGARNYFPDMTKRFVQINNLKYDEYLNNKDVEPVVSYPYILFMDAGLAHLPFLSGRNDSIDKKDYVASMNRLFDRVEAEYHLPVIIAAHPKSGYEGNEFNGRKIILYQTPALLKYAELVLAHYSTSLIDLVLQKKPVIFLYSESYMNSPSQTILISTIQYAKMLNATLIDIKKDEEIKIHFDEEAYDRFINEHIIRDETRSNAEMIVDFLKKFDR